MKTYLNLQPLSNSKIGEYIRIRREAKGWSQDKLSKETGITQQYISEIELGKRNFANDLILHIALALDTVPSEIWLQFEREALPEARIKWKEMKDQE
uniref:HTH cro/C1-type domain-containing protein n=1 Tax=Anaerobacillus isosaccharinicus TaxID=1532552 RepID=A0A1S2MFI3_9BACI